MSEMKNFNKEFVERTLTIIDEYKNDNERKYDVTLLLNCLCGLVTLPIERKKDKDDDSINKFKRKCVNELKKVCEEYNFHKRSFKNSFRSIRNAIAHLHIEVSNAEQKINIIQLTDYKDGKFNKPEIFKIIIKVEKLEEFAKFVATEYLKII